MRLRCHALLIRLARENSVCHHRRMLSVVVVSVVSKRNHSAMISDCAAQKAVPPMWLKTALNYWRCSETIE